MGIYDRYVYQFFGRALLVCFLAFVSIYILSDCLANLDEFITYGERLGSFGQVVTSYYGARMFWFFDRTSAILGLVAAAVTVSWMQRTNELVAVMAAGVSRGRIVRPLLISVLFVILLAVLNRECMIPKYRNALSRNARNWLGDTARPVQPQYDYETQIFFTGSGTYAAEQRIAQPTLYHLPPGLSAFGRQVHAENAYYRLANDKHPAGYLFVNVDAPEDIDSIPSVYNGRRPVILTAADTDWLEAGQCYVASRVEFEQLAGGSAWFMYTTTPQMITALRNPSLNYGADVRVTIHARIVQPLLDLLLFLIGLAVVFTRGGRNVFLAGALAIAVVALFYGLVICCHALGANYLLKPAFAAWCPILVLSPIAYLVAGPIWE